MPLEGGIAAIVPVYNRAVTFLATLGSVAAQAEPPSALFVVDDGSTDGVEKSLERWLEAAQPAFPVRFIRQPHQGASAARNRGIEAAKDCAYFAFLDSDDEWPPDFLARCYSALAACPAAVAVTADRVLHDARTGKRKHESLRSLSTDAPRWLCRFGAGIASCTLFRADPIRLRGGFDETLISGEEDAHLFLPISVMGPWLHQPGAPVIMGMNRAASRNEEGHLRHAHRGYPQFWATIYEDFIRNGAGCRVLPRNFCDSMLASRWYQAGRYWSRENCWKQAQQCFGRSLSYRFRLKTWFHQTIANLHDLGNSKESDWQPARLAEPDEKEQVDDCTFGHSGDCAAGTLQLCPAVTGQHTDTH